MIVRERPCTLSAARLFAPLAHLEGAFLLDSVKAAGEVARWAIFGAFPRARARTRSELFFDRIDVPELAHLPFCGGWVGYLAFDAAHWFEDLPRRAHDDLGLPEADLRLYDTFACLDLRERRLWLVASDAERLAELERALAEPAPARPLATARVIAGPDEQRFGAMVRRAIAYIEAGDVFQVNLAQRLSVEIAGDPWTLYERLAAVSPAPFSAWMRCGELTLVSASPERLVLVGHDRFVETRPIAGTHPRLKDPDADRAMVEKLSRDPKERAEHVMMVDMERNDLGRVAVYGTVRVADMLRVESYSHVHHLVSTVEARLRDDAGPQDVLRAVFPGGTITGAPKVRAMQIIDELEPVRRGVYTGSVGYIGRDGRMDWNIVIRTLQIVRGVGHLYVGAGIVADSVPEREHQETLHKARGLLASMGLEP